MPRTAEERHPRLAAVLRIARDHVDAMVAHARADHPDEACGVIVGPAGSDTPTRFVAMTNADRSPTFFRFDPTEQLRLYQAMDDADEEIVVVYHSHTATEAYPSRTDISYASEPQAHYVLVSTAESGADEGPVSVRSFRILDGQVTEEDLEIAE
jgi:proteasome lid subunit RPN8/RPN11